MQICFVWGNCVVKFQGAANVQSWRVSLALLLIWTERQWPVKATYSTSQFILSEALRILGLASHFCREKTGDFVSTLPINHWCSLWKASYLSHHSHPEILHFSPPSSRCFEPYSRTISWRFLIFVLLISLFLPLKLRRDIIESKFYLFL